MFWFLASINSTAAARLLSLPLWHPSNTTWEAYLLIYSVFTSILSALITGGMFHVYHGFARGIVGSGILLAVRSTIVS